MNAIHRVRSNLEHFGWTDTIHDVALKAANQVMLVKVIKAVAVNRVDPAFLEVPAPYRAMFLDEPVLRHFALDPETGLPPEFLDEALAKGDECYGFIDDRGDLAAYGWYARTSTRIDPPDLRLRFSGRHVYMYKGYTARRHRGHRLHAIGMVRALQHYLELGYEGLVSYVESNNFSSLRSVYRMGYFDFGTIQVVKVFGRYLTRASAGCREWEFGLAPA